MSRINNNDPILVLGEIPSLNFNSSSKLLLTARKVENFAIEYTLMAIQGPTVKQPWVTITHQPIGLIPTFFLLQILNSINFNIHTQEQRPEPQPMPRPVKPRPAQTHRLEQPKASAPAAPKPERPADNGPTPEQIAHFTGEKIGRRIFANSSPHEVLGVAANASQSEIRAAYKKLSIQLHPDKNRGANEILASETFKILIAAFEKLKV